MTSYIQDQLQRELGLSLPVHSVSTVGADEALLIGWFEQEIAPLWDRHRALTEASLRRKMARLRESVIAVLQTLLAKRRGTAPVGGDSRQWKAVERLLDEADAAIQQAETRRRDWSADEAAPVELILQDAAKALVESAKANGKDHKTLMQVIPGVADPGRPNGERGRDRTPEDLELCLGSLGDDPAVGEGRHGCHPQRPAGRIARH